MHGESTIVDHVHPGLPDGLELYARTPDFTDRSMPLMFGSGYMTSAGVWALIRVIEGALNFVEPGSGSGARHVEANDVAIVRPLTPFRIALAGPTRFFLEFHLRSARVARAVQSNLATDGRRHELKC